MPKERLFHYHPRQRWVKKRIHPQLLPAMASQRSHHAPRAPHAPSRLTRNSSRKDRARRLHPISRALQPRRTTRMLSADDHKERGTLYGVPDGKTLHFGDPRGRIPLRGSAPDLSPEVEGVQGIPKN